MNAASLATSCLLDLAHAKAATPLALLGPEYEAHFGG